MDNFWSFLNQTLALSVTAALILLLKKLFEDKLSPGGSSGSGPSSPCGCCCRWGSFTAISSPRGRCCWRGGKIPWREHAAPLSPPPTRPSPYRLPSLSFRMDFPFPGASPTGSSTSTRSGWCSPFCSWLGPIVSSAIQYPRDVRRVRRRRPRSRLWRRPTPSPCPGGSWCCPRWRAPSSVAFFGRCWCFRSGRWTTRCCSMSSFTSGTATCGPG